MITIGITILIITVIAVIIILCKWHIASPKGLYAKAKIWPWVVIAETAYSLELPEYMPEFRFTTGNAEEGGTGYLENHDGHPPLTIYALATQALAEKYYGTESCSMGPWIVGFFEEQGTADNYVNLVKNNPCSSCNGRGGDIYHEGIYAHWRTCTSCGGRGYDGNRECESDGPGILRYLPGNGIIPRAIGVDMT